MVTYELPTRERGSMSNMPFHCINWAGQCQIQCNHCAAALPLPVPGREEVERLVTRIRFVMPHAQAVDAILALLASQAPQPETQQLIDELRNANASRDSFYLLNGLMQKAANALATPSPHVGEGGTMERALRRLAHIAKTCRAISNQTVTEIVNEAFSSPTQGGVAERWPAQVRSVQRLLESNFSDEGTWFNTDAMNAVRFMDSLLRVDAPSAPPPAIPDDHAG